VRTDDLIDALASDAASASGATPRRRLALVGGLGALSALLLVMSWLHLRHDLMQAMSGSMFWMKVGYTGLLGLAGYVAIERLARPAGSGRRGWTLAGALLALCLLAGAIQALTSADPREALTLVRGHSWNVCSRNIMILSLPMLALGLWAVRGMAPTRPVLAGAAVGLFAGGVGATVYCLHCPEHTITFVSLWYSLGVVGAAGLGALVGRWALRW
jgi:hypothetical protein